VGLLQTATLLDPRQSLIGIDVRLKERGLTKANAPARRDAVIHRSALLLVVFGRGRFAGIAVRADVWN
jgi:hypothetical protein